MGATGSPLAGWICRLVHCAHMHAIPVHCAGLGSQNYHATGGNNLTTTRHLKVTFRGQFRQGWNMDSIMRHN